MKKFFLFKRDEDSVSSGSTSSNTGVGISTISIPADSVSYMTTKKEGVIIVFNNASAFKESFLKPGQSTPNTTVEVSCSSGSESELMEQILNFISSPSGKNVMRFDSVSKNSTFPSFSEEKGSVKVFVPTFPVDTLTGEISEGDEQDEYLNKIAGINFLKSKPDIDFNHEGLSGFADTDTVSSWTNDGLLGGSYNISSVNNTPECVDPDVRDRGLTTKAVNMAENEYMIVPEYSAKREYVVYLVWTTQYTDLLFSPYLMPMYGDSLGETLGPGGKFPDSGPADKVYLDHSKLSFRHAGQSDAPVTQRTNKRIPQEIFSDTTSDEKVPCHVLVIRRDEDYNIYVYDRDGEEVARFPNNFGSNEGSLIIERLGTTNEIDGNSFHKGSIARFGVISEDPGEEFASSLAVNLFNYYNNI